MSRARASIDIPQVRISEVEALWYDHTRWQGFVDGLHHVEQVQGPYPDVGARVTWASNHGGRGPVIERVVAYERRVGQTLEVEDEKTTGSQRVAFSALEDGVHIELELEYAIRSPTLTTALSDFFFIRRAQTDSLRRTLLRFARELHDELHPAI